MASSFGQNLISATTVVPSQHQSKTINGLQFNSHSRHKSRGDADDHHLLLAPLRNGTAHPIIVSKSTHGTPVNRRVNHNNNLINNAKSAGELTTANMPHANHLHSRDDHRLCDTIKPRYADQIQTDQSCDSTSDEQDTVTTKSLARINVELANEEANRFKFPSHHHSSGFVDYSGAPSLQLKLLNSKRYMQSLQLQNQLLNGGGGGGGGGAHHHSPLQQQQQGEFSAGGSHPVFGRSSESGSHVSRYTDVGSVRSWTSVGMGSTDGRKMIVRRVPTSPVELFNIVNPPTPPEEYLYDDSFDGSEDGGSTYFKRRRPKWANKIQFVLACVGYSVGLGSVWRFPYLCYKSGGGVFLIPYAITMIICGVPMLYMELAVGQFIGRGPIGALGHLCPLFKGTGLASVVISFLMSTYYCVIIAYGIYYFFTSFKPNQPWMDCSNTWNTPNCWNPHNHLQDNTSRPFHSKTPAEEFYNEKVLQVSKGIEDFSPLRWELVACLLCAWILVYFAIWKSIKSSAKVRYFTATLPFLLIVIFMAKSLTLEGADKGMRYFFRPDWHMLGDAKVWVNALAQTFNSMGIAFGSMICFASYNKFNNNILHDTLAVSCVNAITSLLVGILAFATIGNIAHEQNTEIEDVIADGPGLIFVVYPQAMAKMPGAHVWAVLFFFMLLCLALNSQFAIVEVVVTSIQDGFPTWIKKKLICHEMLVFIVCVVSFFCGFPNVTRGGIYFFQLIDHYAASISIMYIAFTEIIAVAWFYGVWRLSRNVEEMTGRQPSLYFRFCWMIAAPLLIFSVWVFYMIEYDTPSYDNGNYRYPTWALAIGWVITSLSILCIPVFALVNWYKAEGENWRVKFLNIIRPNIFECDKCKQHHCEHHDQLFDSEPMLDIVRPPLIPHENGGPPTGTTIHGGILTRTYSTAPNSPTPNRHTIRMGMMTTGSANYTPLTTTTATSGSGGQHTSSSSASAESRH